MREREPKAAWPKWTVVEMPCPVEECFEGNVICYDCGGECKNPDGSYCLPCLGDGEVPHKYCDGLGVIYVRKLVW